MYELGIGVPLCWATFALQIHASKAEHAETNAPLKTDTQILA